MLAVKKWTFGIVCYDTNFHYVSVYHRKSAQMVLKVGLWLALFQQFPT